MNQYQKKLTDELSVVLCGSKMGVVNQSGTEIIPVKYTNINYVQNHEQFIVKQGKKCGILGKDGSKITALKYDHIAPATRGDDMGEGYEIRKDDGIGWINIEGKELIPPKFKHYTSFNDKYYIAYDNHSHVDAELFSKEGKRMFSENYFRVEDGGEGFIFVESHWKGGRGHLYAIFNADCEQVTDFIYYNIRPYKNGFCRANTSASYIKDDTMPGASMENPEKKWGFIDKFGKPITEFKYEKAWDFSEGFAAVEKDELCGYIDEQGNEIIPLQHITALDFQNGYVPAIVEEKTERSSIIDKTGKTIISSEDCVIGPVTKQGIAQFMTQDEKAWGYTDLTNFYKFAYYEKEHRFLFQDEEGNLAPIPLLKDIRPCIDNSFRVTLNEKHGMVDGEGNIILEPQYEDMSSTFWGDFGFAKQNGKYAFINRKGEPLTDFIFEKAGFLMRGFGVGVTAFDPELGYAPYFLVNESGNISEKGYKYIGTDGNRSVYDEELSKWVESYGGEWLWYILQGEYYFVDSLKKDTISNDINYSCLKEDVDYEVPYFKCFSYKALDKHCKEIKSVLEKDALCDMTLPKPEFLRQPPDIIAESKIQKAKNSFNPNYGSAHDAYYLSYYQSKVYDLVDSFQNRFLCGLAGAISEWILWRISETCNKYLNVEYAFQKLEALYAGSAFPALANNHLDSEIGICKDSVPNFDTLEKKEQECIDVLDDLLFIWHMFYRNYNNYDYHTYGEAVPFIVLARQILSGNAKKAFNNWLEDVLEKGTKYYSRGFVYKNYTDGVYNYHLDEMVPREFFWNSDYKPSKLENEKQVQAFLESLDWENNPYLDASAYTKLDLQWYDIMI